MSTWDALRAKGLGDRYYAFDIMRPETDERIRDAEKTIPSTLYWLSGSPPEGTGWDPIDARRNMFRPSPVDIPEWVNPAYVRHNVATFARTGFHGGLNQYRGVQATFDQLSAYKDVLIERPSLYIWGGSDGLCRLFHPTPPTLAEIRAMAPGIVDVIRLDGVGHWPQHEARERVDAEIVAFLRGLDG